MVKGFIKRIKAFNKLQKTRPILEDSIETKLGEKGEQDDKISYKVNLVIHIRELKTS